MEKDAVTQWASVINRTDYLKVGRGARQWGLARLNKQGLKKFLLEGKRGSGAWFKSDRETEMQLARMGPGFTLPPLHRFQIAVRRDQSGQAVWLGSISTPLGGLAVRSLLSFERVLP